MKEVIDFYFDTKKINENESAFDDEKKIFELMKEKQEDYLIIIYFLLNIYLDEYDEDMTEYVCNNISDEIIIKEFTKIIFFIRKNLSKLINGNYKANKKGKINGKVIECPFKSDELSGIISYLCKSSNNNVVLSSNGTPANGHPLENLIKFDSENINPNYMNSYEESDKWIQFDFGERKINLTSYTVRCASKVMKYFWIQR